MRCRKRGQYVSASGGDIEASSARNLCVDAVIEDARLSLSNQHTSIQTHAFKQERKSPCCLKAYPPTAPGPAQRAAPGPLGGERTHPHRAPPLWPQTGGKNGAERFTDNKNARVLLTVNNIWY